MKRNFIWGVLAVAGLSFLSSCKDDETPVTGISFETEEQEVTESDGTFESFHPDIADEGEGRIIHVKLVLDRSLAGDAVIKFDLDGTAREKANSDEVNDFEIVEEGENVTIDDDEITILKGAKEASFDILIYEDLLFEYDEDALNDDGVPYETVVLTLESVVSGPVKLGAQVEHTLKIMEDDAVAFLQWEAQDMEPEEANVDMDILFWVNGSIQWAGAQEGTAFEGVNIPAGLGEGDFGISYTYYSGNSNDLDFKGVLFNTAGTLNEERYTYPNDDPLIFEGNYTLANVNQYDASNPPKIAQTMAKSGIDYSNISGISSFDSGSRIIGNKIPLKLDRSVLRRISSASSRVKTLRRK